MDKEGKLDEQELKDLIHVFRPNRDGSISMIDFCKSIDTVYKEIRKLRASIANESRMNAGAENVINCIFYFILVLGALLVYSDEAGDVYAIFAGLFAITLPFAFCFGGAAAEYVKGISFILIQRPYDIGDRIAITGASESISGTGRPQWLVTDVSL
jgi:small-conductance mechanosensitive channel